MPDPLVRLAAVNAPTSWDDIGCRLKDNFNVSCEPQSCFLVWYSIAGDLPPLLSMVASPWSCCLGPHPLF